MPRNAVPAPIEIDNSLQRFASCEAMAASLEHCGTGVQEPLWQSLPQIDIPVLVLAGSRDAKFSELGMRMAEAIGANARFISLDGGHAVHLENPTDTAATILDWIAGIV